VKEQCVRFSLQDVKKQVQRRGSDLYVSLHFLRPGELHAEIARLIAFHEQHTGLPQRQFSIDEARALIADYRLANCLLATLSAWYAWQQPDWKETLLGLENDALTRLEEAGITSPIYLRLALYNYINEHYSGFLDGQQRDEVLQAFATSHGLNLAGLEYLLALDSDSETVLVRETHHPPSVQEVASLYNQWTFEAALFNASDVHFAIDCQAFIEAQNIESSSRVPATGIGSVIKRLCYLARKLGVYYDLAYETGQSPAILHLTLYGPQEMTGAPQQYGLRLARLCRMILDYGSSRPSSTTPSTAPSRRGRLIAPTADLSARQLMPTASAQRSEAHINPSASRSRPNLIGAIREAEATVHFLQRAYRFVMGADLLKLLPSDTKSPEVASYSINGETGSSIEEEYSDPQGQIDRAPGSVSPTSSQKVENPPSIFDSSIEQSFAEAFGALANSQATDGWQLEREPEPLLLPSPSGEMASQSIFIPDFALTRGSHRIYVEILGFWTPSYRERKVARLQQLKTRNDLVLAIPAEARPAFAAIASDFPIVEYDGQLSATELLQVLRSRYDDVEERLARIDVEMVREHVMKEGLVPERACYELLHCYRRSELQRAAQFVVTGTIAFTMGVGLYTTHWLEHMQASFVHWVESAARERSTPEISLQEAVQYCRSQSAILEQCEDTIIEALIGLWPQVQVSRSSIFDATIHLANSTEARVLADQPDENESVRSVAHTPGDLLPRKQIREQRAAYRRGDPAGRPLANKGRSPAHKSRSSSNETVQGDLWG
jgi:predicted nuclease of restriction endonuclease-like RecB superfamily